MKTKKELQTALIQARRRAYEAWVKAQGYLPETEPQQLAHIADMDVHKMEREIALFDASMPYLTEAISKARGAIVAAERKEP